MRDITASIRARLFNWAKERSIQFQYASMLYMQEGILSRLAASPFADKLILKGGFLLFTHSGNSGRMTKDIDFLGQEISNDEALLAEAFVQILGIHQDDGLVYDTKSILTERITEGADYHGVRVSVGCNLGSLRNRLQIDVGFGDAISPGPSRLTITSMLGRPAVEVAAYPLATVIAEKFEAMIVLGSVNSRMKDFFDVAFLLDHYDFSDAELKAALIATFTRRNTTFPENPAVFSKEFADLEQIQVLWAGFLKRTQLGDVALASVIETIRKRLEPFYEELKNAAEKLKETP